MNPELWLRVEQLFHRACELPPDQREAFVANSGEADEVRSEALRWLSAGANSDFLKPPTVGGETAPLPDDPTLWVGRQFGDFELLEKLGSGGMGIVFRARQRGLRREVAVKFLPPSPLMRPKHSDRFERESEAAARLHHANIVAIHAVGREGEVRWFAMELIDGLDLAHEIDHVAGRSNLPRTRLPAFSSPEYISTVARIVEQAADALQYAHEQGIIHRDVKPSNLLLDEHSNVRVVDFGLARDTSMGSITEPGEQAGTAFYMSPEQVRTSLHAVDTRTDVYSLGVVLFELLTLRRPYDGATRDEIYDRIQHADAPRLRALVPRVPRDLELVCNTAMARELPERYASAAEFRDDLRRFLRHEAVVAKAPSLARRTRKFASKRRVPLLVGGAAVAALVIGAEFSSKRAHDRAVATDVGMFERAVNAENWDNAVGQVVDARLRWRELRDSRASLPAKLGAAWSKLELRFASDREQRVTIVRELLRRGLGGELAPGERGGWASPPSERELALFRQEVERARTIYSDDAEVLALASTDTTYPSISIRLDEKTQADSGELTARVRARPIDPLLGTRGPAIDLGHTPLETRLAPGNWRFVVELPGYGFAEYTRYLVARKTPYEIVARVRRESAVTRGMKMIASGNYVFDAKRPMACDVAGPSADFEAFWIDDAETSNREYIEFLEDTQYPAPKRWRDFGYAGDWHVLPLGDAVDRFLDLPIAGINVVDAQAFTEWAGKRLPTHVELERALRGSQGALNPWGDGERSDAFGACNIDGTDVALPTTPREYFDSYLANTRAVRDERFRQAPAQLLHAFGNVAEYTESLLAEPHDGVLITDPWSRVFLGAPWDAISQHNSLDFHATTGLGERYTTDFVGIRCCHSATP